MKGNTLRRGFKAWADDKAIEYRKKLNLYYYDPLPAKKLATLFDVLLITPDKLLHDNPKYLSILSQNGSSEWSAITVRNQENKYVVVHNQKHSKSRQESNIMHELAHIICNHEPEEFEARENFPFQFLRNYNTNQEEEAKWLGACLQLPRKALEWSFKQGMNETDIVDFYNASSSMVKFRINTTGIKYQFSRYKNKLKKLS
ncbi:MAG: ImmA/IrrE family metallo-endopeptidase [Ignavibacteriae bacterium]|nr:ImmA/IrrE family metallo-endopeptidase [Ignavibacteriota bacterium]